VTAGFESVNEYIASFPNEVQEVLSEMRGLIREALPAAEEKISYQIPTYTVDGKAFIFFAAWKTHVSLHAIPLLDEPLESEVAPYRSGKDTIRFPLQDPLPGDLVTRIVTAMRDAKTGAGG
jgi:uncharacterized protein YdhG (YjbR/CyaY superfamily)